MKKLLSVLISSAMLVSAGQVFAQNSAPDASGSSMSKDQSTSDDGMSKKSKKHSKRMHKKSKSNSENSTTKSMGSETDNSVQNKKNP